MTVFEDAAAAFGLEVRDVDPLPGERTLNARVVGGDGAVYVVKLHAQHEADDVDLEVAALDHLAGTLAASLLPEPLRAPGGRAAVPVGDRLARVLAWLPGQVWADAGPPSPARRRALGAAVERL